MVDIRAQKRPKKVPDVVFGEVIREAREKCDLSQEKLAAEAGLHRTYISQIERGLKTPTLISLLKLASAVNSTANQLVADVEAKLDQLGYDVGEE